MQTYAKPRENHSGSAAQVDGTSYGKNHFQQNNSSEAQLRWHLIHRL